MPGLSSAAPVYSADGEFVGAVAVEIELYKISEFLAGIKVGRTGKVFLVNPEGKVVAYPDAKAGGGYFLVLAALEEAGGPPGSGIWVLE